MLNNKHILKVFKRAYHDSSIRARRLPIAKVASSRVGRALKDKKHIESRVETYDPTKRFEPFPFAITEENKLHVLKTKVTPLIDIPYEEQLASKESFCKNALRLLAQDLYKQGTPVRLDVKRLPCPVHPIVKSPITEKYRNKDEFSIWRGLDGQTNTVGYMAFPLGKHGDTICLEPNGCEIMKDESIKMANIAQDFIRYQAKLPVCYHLGAAGGWRRFGTKINADGEIMFIGVLSPTMLKVQQVVDERENFKNYIIQKSQDVGLKLKSLYFQPCPHNKCLHKDVPYEHLYGEKTIIETINNYKYLLSPESFAPQNSAGGSQLYNTIRKTLEEAFSINIKSDNKPLIIDTNCGVGMLSTQLSDLASKIIGIDSSSQAIDDAIANAKLNGVDNVEFLNLNLEIALERVLEKYSRNRQETIVVCSPPKIGLRPNVDEALRVCNDVKKIIYVTTKPDSQRIMNNLINLCRKRAGNSPPFVPVSATPVDVYPHVDAVECVIALERLAV